MYEASDKINVKQVLKAMILKLFKYTLFNETYINAREAMSFTNTGNNHFTARR